ncbi:MAG TPA: NADH-quinone oxidoreductase subunit M [Planctomycetota bacterium]|jgi:NADH-quinone oxidoreductase subunit M|nr:NADH-quinone oxidoreductase subunit M [Planctomycetota bacterium]
MNPVLPILVFAPAAGAAVLALAPRGGARDPLRFAFGISLLPLAIALGLFFAFDASSASPQFPFSTAWFRSGGVDVRFAFGIDGISLLLIALTALLGPIFFLAAPGHIAQRRREFAAWGLLMQTGMLGVFAVSDLVLFYVFWEVSLVPLYFVIGIWGGTGRARATTKFVLFTIAGSLLLLLALLAVLLEAGTADLFELARGRRLLPASIERLAFLGFALGFAVKVPLLPFHTWLPEAHVEAPTSGSVVLAGVLLKMGTYGLLRFCLPMFPRASAEFAPLLLGLGAAGAVYGALLAWAQRDLKKLVAYSSISHLGLVAMGLFAREATAVEGALLQMVNHGLSTGALFLLVGVLYDRTHRRGLDDFGGVAKSMPLFAALLGLTAFASIGLPGLNGFVGEFLILAGTFSVTPVPAAVATAAVVLSAVYLLGAVRTVLFGPALPATARLPDCTKREAATLLPLAGGMVLLGVLPGPFLERIRPSVAQVVERTRALAQAEPARPEGQR